MRNRTAYHSREGYKEGSGAACFGVLRCTSPRRSGFARPLARNPRGFTLVEVVVAAAILVILLLALMGSFSAGVTGFKIAQLMTFGQNLAEFQAEDLKSLPSSILRQLCEGIATGVAPGVPAKYTNYPYPTADVSDPAYDDAARVNDAKAWVYDSGEVQTDFSIVGVDAIVKDDSTEYPTSYRSGGTTPPLIPTDPPLLLGTSILVEAYLRDDPVPPDEWYYAIRLMHQAYPLFSKRVLVECYDARNPDFHFVSNPSQTVMDEYVSDARAMFSYTITVFYHQGLSQRTLYETRGIISSPYS
jgi:prepilin-type N-terminal cleavage/methylation domain-containing protein